MIFIPCKKQPKRYFFTFFKGQLRS
ncbi:conserved protein of unknown function [Ectopseudomonas oleovorans]|uniref:Uncharacterized protein n=1 Tax=Ectopseudomonas oleovorans TaxID=301 RepID=A0A653BD69_ECTOL|nr:conserved protein of unknown function [Pseudomonas oleovorans]